MTLLGHPKSTITSPFWLERLDAVYPWRLANCLFDNGTPGTRLVVFRPRGGNRPISRPPRWPPPEGQEITIEGRRTSELIPNWFVWQGVLDFLDKDRMDNEGGGAYGD